MTPDELDLDERIRRGNAVARFLTDEDIQKVFNGMEEAYFRRWKESQNPTDREDLRAEARAFDTLNRALLGIVNDGDSAKHQLQQQNKPSVY